MKSVHNQYLFVGYKKLVGAAGFEPATSRTPSVRATRLRHAPTTLKDAGEFSTAAVSNQFNLNLNVTL